MSESKDVKFCLKVMVNKQKNKVLFAVADSNFADVLISFLTMPLGTVARTLVNHYGDKTPAIGSLTSLYLGFANLDTANFWTEGCKETLLNPRSPFEEECRKLKFDVSDTQPPQFFVCQNICCGLRDEKFTCRSVFYDTAKCDCGEPMIREVGQKESPAHNDAGAVFTVDTLSYIISDDLQIFPNVTGLVETIRKLGITDTNGAELSNLTFGFNEIMDLLKTTLLSRTPLTDFILNKRHISNKARVSLHQIKKEATSYSKKMNSKVILQKSTNKLLFAQVEHDFVDFLSSLLAIPLGLVEHLCGGNTGLNSIDNLYRSILDMDDKYLATLDLKTRLLNPKLPHGYIPKDPILPVTEERISYIYTTLTGISRMISPFSIKFQKGKGKYVKEPRMYKITDDLTITLFCPASTISALNKLNIPVSDLQELHLEMGLEEALDIVKASLTSSYALTDGLMISTLLKKQPKQEHH